MMSRSHDDAGDGDSGTSTPSSGSGTTRKQLPSIPDVETAVTPGIRTPPRHGNIGYGPFFLEYSLMAEFNQLPKQNLPGVYVIPSEKSALVWNGVLFIRQGMYQDGVFRFHLNIPDNYPDGDCPSVFFTPPVFHPLIHANTGELDVRRAFHKWRRNVNHLWQVLYYVRCVFFKIDTKNAMNPEAANIYEQSADVYKERVTQCVQMCKDSLYTTPDTDDLHAIRFSPWDPSVHADVQQQICHSKCPTDDDRLIQNIGLSWIAPGSTQIFSKQDTNAT